MARADSFFRIPFHRSSRLEFVHSSTMTRDVSASDVRLEHAICPISPRSELIVRLPNGYPISDTDARPFVRTLSGFLCGTHSGALAHSGRDHVVDERFLDRLRGLAYIRDPHEVVGLGARKWQAPQQSALLAERLSAVLEAPPIVDLIIFGSHARASTTGFSDLDAVLVLDGSAIRDVGSLRSLRRRVLAAQRVVMAYQPMQHHGFEVVTTTLLHRATEALAMPREAFLETCSLYGTTVEAHFAEADPVSTRKSLRSIGRTLASVGAWPSHPWHLHRMISMFELIPALYLQARGIAIPKSASFDLARRDFADDWWPYEELARVRESWPRLRRRTLEVAATAARNPWLATAIWSRLPGFPPRAARTLNAECLVALQSLAHRMME